MFKLGGLVPRRNAAYREIFATDAGRIVLADLARFCNAGRELFVPGDPHQTAYNVGKLRVLSRIRSFLDIDDAELGRVMRDHAQPEVE
jgi:hypothetical protein